MRSEKTPVAGTSLAGEHNQPCARLFHLSAEADILLTSVAIAVQISFTALQVNSMASVRTRQCNARYVAGLVCLLSVVAGCEAGSKLVPVTGKITVDGKPAEGAVILFHPDGNQVMSVSSAVANADGSFSPVTDSEPGMPVGRYKVSVNWPDPSVKPTENQIMMGNAEPGPDLLKGRYISKDKSNLTAEVSATTTELPPLTLTTR